jgi:WD40 repeat protein
MRCCALEIFTADRHSFFYNFFQIETRVDVEKTIRRAKPPRLAPRVDTAKRVQLLMAQWVNREVSNFDYLMELNNLAGRSYNDLAQYPVFPWILADYTSPTINLRDPSVYRDLKKNMGCQTPEREKNFKEKYSQTEECYTEQQRMLDAGEDMVDMVVLQGPPWHFGTHFSNPQAVLWYLLRLEPFTSLHVFLQDGRFDRPDRQFWSIASAWEGVTAASNTSDVKELIPEFFFLPDFLYNTNNVYFGALQGKGAKVVDDVALPPWANGSAEEFIRIHREALESDYVSSNLHHWVDLVFGCKQRGPYMAGGSQKAVDACNVFFHLTYDGAVDLDHLYNIRPGLYDTVINMINNYGQTPGQLLNRAHQPRKQLEDLVFPLFSQVLGLDTIPLPVARDPLLFLKREDAAAQQHATYVKMNKEVRGGARGIRRDRIQSDIVIKSSTSPFTTPPLRGAVQGGLERTGVGGARSSPSPMDPLTLRRSATTTGEKGGIGGGGQGGLSPDGSNSNGTPPRTPASTPGSGGERGERRHRGGTLAGKGGDRGERGGRRRGSKSSSGRPKKILAKPKVIVAYAPARVARGEPSDRSSSVLFVRQLQGVEKLVTVCGAARELGLHRWSPKPPDIEPPFDFELDPRLAVYTTRRAAQRSSSSSSSTSGAPPRSSSKLALAHDKVVLKRYKPRNAGSAGSSVQVGVPLASGSGGQGIFIDTPLPRIHRRRARIQDNSSSSSNNSSGAGGGAGAGTSGGGSSSSSKGGGRRATSPEAMPAARGAAQASPGSSSGGGGDAHGGEGGGAYAGGGGSRAGGHKNSPSRVGGRVAVGSGRTSHHTRNATDAPHERNDRRESSSYHNGPNGPNDPNGTPPHAGTWPRKQAGRRGTAGGGTGGGGGGGANTGRTPRRVGSEFTGDDGTNGASLPPGVAQGLFAVSEDHRCVFSAGHWDNTMRVTALDGGQTLQILPQHSEVVTCIALSEERAQWTDTGGHVLVTGSRDCTVVVWALQKTGGRIIAALNGHGLGATMPAHGGGGGGGILSGGVGGLGGGGVIPPLEGMMGTGDHRMNTTSDGGSFMMGQSGSFMGGGGGGGHSSSVSMSTSVSSMSLAQMSLGSPSVVSTMDQQQQQQHPFFNMERGTTGGSGGGGYMGVESLADQAATQNITQGPVRNRPLHILYGHDAAVTSVAVNTGLDLLISGSEDWTCIIHTLKEGAYVRTLSMHDTSPSSFTGFGGAFDGAVGGGGGKGASAGGNGSGGFGGGDGGVGGLSPESTRGARGGNAAKESSPFGVWGDEAKHGGGGRGDSR